jgi:hypothetical protein
MEASSLRLDAEGRNRGSRYLGVDLAWTEAGWSGACVLDADGTILGDRPVPGIGVELELAEVSEPSPRCDVAPVGVSDNGGTDGALG